jgi:predicted nuclease of predicted toxin-antitoxin system
VILADENVLSAVVEGLRADGWDVASIAELAPASDDADILARAAREGRVLLTDDKDFGELVVREGRAHGGVALLRLHGMRPLQRALLVSRVLGSLMGEIRGNFAVVERDGAVRIRKSGERRRT